MSAVHGSALGRPRSGETEQRRGRLIATAGGLFIAHGYHQVSLALIAREARVALRTIYAGFGGKAGLLDAVLREGRARFMDEQHVLDPDSGSIEHVLGTFGLRYLRFLSDPDVVRMRRMVLAEAGSNPELEQTYREAGPGLTRAMLGRYFDDPRVRPRLRDEVDPRLLPGHFIACIAGERLWPGDCPPDDACEQALRQELRQRLQLFLRAALRQD